MKLRLSPGDIDPNGMSAFFRYAAWKFNSLPKYEGLPMLFCMITHKTMG